MCDCINRIETRLKNRNTRLSRVFSIVDGEMIENIYVAVEQVEKGRGKAKAIIVIPLYCPFCGGNMRDERLPKEAFDHAKAS